MNSLVKIILSNYVKEALTNDENRVIMPQSRYKSLQRALGKYHFDNWIKEHKIKLLVRG